MRLIDAEALESALHDLMKRRNVKSWMSTAFDACDFEMLIDEAPTIDTEHSTMMNEEEEING